MRPLLLVLLLSTSAVAAALGQQTPAAPATDSAYDPALAQRLGADERGMRRYVLVILKTGPKTDIPKDERSKMFSGHMANIGRLAAEGKLLLAGPMMEENERHFEGIFVFDVPTVADAIPLLATDPAVAGGALAYEAFAWYATAALKDVPAIHRRIDKTSRPK